MTNLYSPPSASLDQVATVEQFTKPKAVLLMQLLAFPLLAFLCYGVVNNAILALRENTEIIAGLSVTARLAVISGAAIFIAATLLAIYKRAAISRILGPLFMLMLCLPVMIVSVLQTPPHQDSSAYMVGQAIGWIVIVAPFIAWAYAFSLTRRARGYFGTAQTPKPERFEI